MVILQEFTEKDFKLFKTWITDAEMLAIFAGPIFSFPIKDSELFKYISRSDIKPFKVILQETGEVIGHCELNYSRETPRLSRILIGQKSMRGKGLGNQVVTEMASLLFQDSSVQKVDLNVFDFNQPAIKCYEKVGFTVNPVPTKDLIVNGKTWKRLNMVLSRNRFNP